MIKDMKKKIALTIITLLFTICLLYNYNYVAFVLVVIDLGLLWKK